MGSNGNKKKVKDDFIAYIKAGYPYFYVETSEMSRTLSILTSAMDEYNKDLSGRGKDDMTWKVLTWDMLGNPDSAGNPTLDGEQAEPFGILEAMVKESSRTVVFLKNFNWFMINDYNKPEKEVATLLQNNYNIFCKTERRKALVIVSDVPFESGIPDMLKKDFLPLEFDLPDEAELMEVLERIIRAAKKSKEFKVPDEETKERLVDAALGLALQEAENAFSYCAISYKELVPKIIDRIKAQQIEGIPGVSYVEPSSSFDNLIGFDKMKLLAIASLEHELGKGISVVGPPGTGKTEFFKCLAAFSKKRCLWMELAECQGGIVGDTERNVRNMIKAAIAMSGSKGVIVVFDEMEKGLAGASASAGTVSSDSIQRRAMSQLLKFMQDPGCKIWFAATFNSIEGVDGEYLRAERWDTSPFYIELPDGKQRKAILEHYANQYEVEPTLTAKDTNGWSGAELKAVCRLSKMLGMPLDKAKDYIVPISITKKQQIDKLRAWAKTGAVSATSVEKADIAERDLDF